ncbi:deoxyribodipyrimidine photo-lyase [bacterium A37T11]|nr:deoxyribodipyrimidine photo-lyase [bacterium A37T11]
MEKINIFWFRRDLRLEDHQGLRAAMASGRKVLPIFIFDLSILERLDDQYDRRVDYIYQALQFIHAQLKMFHSGIRVYHSHPVDAFEQLTAEFSIHTVYCTNDYEPKALQRDSQIRQLLAAKQIGFVSVKDQVMFEQDEIMKPDGTPYTVFTPYATKWREKLSRTADYSKCPHAPAQNSWFTFQADDLISLHTLGFKKTDVQFSPPQLPINFIQHYHQKHNFPALDSTTHLGIALRFGTISIRECVQAALNRSDAWLNELIWREFFMQILYHFPHVVNHCFKPSYEVIAWRNDEKEFKAWCEGKTGYPLVDAGMHQLNETGFMHNRVRLVTASFLCKHLLIDWRWGEAYFAARLLDYELASNNGNWQWAAGCGCDAAPYFRIFNPDLQQKKFDKNLEYVKRWNPDFQDVFNLPPIVDHVTARKRALAVYSKALR